MISIYFYTYISAAQRESAFNFYYFPFSVSLLLLIAYCFSFLHNGPRVWQAKAIFRPIDGRLKNARSSKQNGNAVVPYLRCNLFTARTCVHIHTSTMKTIWLRGWWIWEETQCEMSEIFIVASSHDMILLHVHLIDGEFWVTQCEIFHRRRMWYMRCMILLHACACSFCEWWEYIAENHIQL